MRFDGTPFAEYSSEIGITGIARTPDRKPLPHRQRAGRSECTSPAFLQSDAGSYRGTIRSPRLEVQLKCTAEPIWQSDPMRFALKKKNYDDLRGDDLLVPRMLIVVCVPEDITLWLDQSEERMILQRCGYYLSLRDFPARPASQGSITVQIPRRQQFTVTELRRMMDMIGKGQRP